MTRTKLILLNGPPAVGKSALARRYVDDHALTLLVDIDAIRVSLGGWEGHEESKLIARSLAIALAEAHLRSGRDVVVPQLLGRTEFIETLDQLASGVGADFVEILLMDTQPAVVERFLTRRAELSESDDAHPQADVDDAGAPDAIAQWFELLEVVRRERRRTRVISATDGLENSYRALCRAVEITASG